MGGSPPERRPWAHFARYWLPVLLYVSAIFALSSRPRLQPPLHFPNADKLCHVAEYLGLGVLLVRALRASGRGRAILFATTTALAIGVLVGASDEFLQKFVPGRDSSLLDLLADASGLVLAQLFYLLIVRE